MTTTNDDSKSPNIGAFHLLPCDHYDHEYRQCSSFRGRIDRYYRGISSSSDECKKFRELFDDCAKYEREPVGNFDALLRLNNYENDLMRKRADASRLNDVWERRTRPPSDWNAPLPDWCQEKIANSSWYKSIHSKNNNTTSKSNENN